MELKQGAEAAFHYKLMMATPRGLHTDDDPTGLEGYFLRIIVFRSSLPSNVKL